jgi:peptidoglycan hydrolase-like protein with peptidoglycan-binding domain
MKTTNKKFIFTSSVLALAIALAVAPSFASAQTLYRQLQLGMSGTDVSSLQTFLRVDATIYPEGLVTGYFGGLTKAAVARFQARNGLPAVGRVGPATLPVINAQMASMGSNAVGGRAASISNVAVSINGRIPTVTWNTDEASKGVVYYSTTPLVAYERENAVDINSASIMTDINFRNSQSIAIPNLAANTTYYFMLHTTDQDGNVSVSWPSTFRTAN